MPLQIMILSGLAAFCCYASLFILPYVRRRWGGRCATRLLYSSLAVSILLMGAAAAPDPVHFFEANQALLPHRYGRAISLRER